MQVCTRKCRWNGNNTEINLYFISQTIYKIHLPTQGVNKSKIDNTGM